jgi:hypothetical protein
VFHKGNFVVYEAAAKGPARLGFAESR